MSKTRKSIRPTRNVFQASGTAMSATSWPATSSITTNCGSFAPDARSTCVAAGIPIRVTSAAAMIVAQVRASGGMRELISAQTITVATDPQVPGPGWRRPAPNNVATRVAHTGARGRDAPATAGGTPALRSGGVMLAAWVGCFRASSLGRRDCCPGLLPPRLSLAT